MPPDSLFSAKHQGALADDAAASDTTVFAAAARRSQRCRSPQSQEGVTGARGGAERRTIAGGDQKAAQDLSLAVSASGRGLKFTSGKIGNHSV